MKKLKLFIAALAVFGGGNFVNAQTDVTSTYLTNAGFDNCTAETSDVAAKTIKNYSSTGWTNAQTGSYTTIAVTAYGSGVKVGSSTTPSTKKDGTTVAGNTLGIIAGWSDNVTIQSNDITLPAGVYTLTVDHYLTSSTDNYGSNSSKFGFVTSGSSYLVTSATFTASTWTTETVTFTLTESTTGKIQIGLTGLNKAGSGAPAVFYDDVKLTYTDPNLAAAQVTLSGYIKKAMALNGVLADATLATAITIAEGELESATTSAACNDASDELSSAITAALSGATAVALTNSNFDTTPNNTLSGSTTTFGGTLSTATSNPDNTKDMSANTGDHGYLYDVAGWTQYSKFNSTAAQGTTSEYGTAMPANGWSTNSTMPPAADMFGGTSGATLHLSAGWNDQARYMQTIENLPSGRYVFYYEVINQYSNTGIASNYTGVSGTSGDFYGTSNSFVYSSLNSLEQGVWKAQAFEFDVAKTANVNFHVGVTTSTNGSGNGAKLWIDNVLVYRIGDVIVTDADATAIIAKVDALNESVYNADDKTALATAKSTFEANKTIDNYNALNEALATAQNSVNVYDIINTAITYVASLTTDATNVTDPMRAKYTNGTYSDETIAADIYVEYQAAELAALAADANATDYTSAIINPSFETGDMTGWAAESRTDTGVKEQSNNTYTTTGVDGSYLFNSWGGSAENNVYQTIKSLPAGTYTLSALVAGFTGEDLVLAANSETTTITVADDKTVGYTANLVFTLNEAADVVIKASNTKSQDGSDASFIKADKFRLFKGDAMTTDYSALDPAIAAAEAKTLGFEEGEYAPYINASTLQTLAAAKAIDRTQPMLSAELDEIISTLTDAWTANTEEVNAVNTALFTTGDVTGTGWTCSVGWSQVKEGVFSTSSGTFTYGELTGFTMPLKADTYYKLKFNHRAWDSANSENGGTVSVLCGEDGLAATQFAGQGTSTSPKSETFYFKTGAAGNYVFTLNASSGRPTFGGVTIVKAVTVDVDEEATEAPTAGSYEIATLKRTLSADYWNTFSVPFDMDIPEGWTVKEFDSAEDNVIIFKDAESIVAGKPYLVKPETTATNPTFEGVTIGESVEAQTMGDGDYKFAAQIYNKSLDITGTIAYLSTDGTIKKLTSGGIKGLRAYFIIPADGNARIAFIDGDQTGINDTVRETTNDNRVYDLQGRQVKAVKKGIYVVNGKKVIK